MQYFFGIVEIRGKVLTDLLTQVGSDLAQRWVTSLILPGLLLLVTCYVAITLGQIDSLSYTLLYAKILDDYSALWSEPVLMVISFISFGIGSVALGLGTRRLAQIVESIWFFSKPSWLVMPLVKSRQKKWRNLQAETHEPGSEALFATRVAARNRFALGLPTMPTWMGDRFALTNTRVRAQYGLELAFGWPRLWLIIDDSLRNEVRGHREQLSGAALVVAWGILYVLVGLVWWPSLGIGSILLVFGWLDGRKYTGAFADMVESIVDVYVLKLALSVGLTVAAEVTPDIGEELSERLRKGA